MGATAKISFEEFQNLPERQGTIYELDEGQLVMEPSPALRHNLIRQRIAVRLIQYLEAKHLGVVAEEMDFRLATETVRNPDVAVILKEHLAMIDLDASPVDGAPALAVEVVSPSNSAQDMRKKLSNICARARALCGLCTLHCGLWRSILLPGYARCVNQSR
jgi:Uma2 family endonuclease